MAIKLKCESCGSEYEVGLLSAGEPHRMFCYSCAMALDHEDYGNVSFTPHDAKPVRTVFAEIQDGDNIDD